MKLRWKSVLNILGLSAYSYCVIHLVWNNLVHYAVLIGGSMAPTLNENDKDRDVVLAEHCSRLRKKFKHNDVVLVKDPSDSQKCLCKRIVAMENDALPSDEIGKVPAGHVWLEGDNSEDSYDSRYFGPIPYALIQSRVFYRVWPLSKIGPVK